MGELSVLFIQASYPRSGTTWASLLLEHHYGIGMRSVYGEAEHANTQGKLLWYADHLRLKPSVALKTHEMAVPDRCNGLPSMLIVRDGRDALVSHAHYRVDFDRDPRHATDILRGMVSSPRWTDVHRFWLDRGAIVLRYEDLKADPLGALILAMSRILPGVEPVNTEPMPLTFDEAHGKTPQFFRRGIVGSWRDEMPEVLQGDFWEKHGSMMEELGYSR